MGYRMASEVDCSHVGRRVSVRHRLSEGRATDVVGILEGCDPQWFRVRDRRGELVSVPRDRVIASRLVRPTGTVAGRLIGDEAGRSRRSRMSP